jgi:hypothetical protein
MNGLIESYQLNEGVIDELSFTMDDFGNIIPMTECKGVGSVKNGIVENFKLVTYDIVAAPSDFNATMNGLIESYNDNLNEGKPSIKDTYEKLSVMSKMSLNGYGRRINYPNLLDFKKMDVDDIVSELLAFLYNEKELDVFYKTLR